MGCNKERAGDFMQCKLTDTAKYTKDKEFVYRNGTKYARITKATKAHVDDHEMIIASRVSDNKYINGQLIAIMIKN